MASRGSTWTVVVLIGGLLSGCTQDSAQQPVSGPSTASAVATSAEPAPVFSPTPASPELLAAMLEPQDLEGQWTRVAADVRDSGGVLDGYLCNEGWPDDGFEQLPAWQVVNVLTLSELKKDDSPTITQAAAAGSPAEMRRALEAVRDHMKRCFAHNRTGSGEETTYLPLTVDTGDDAVGALLIQQFTQTTHTVFLVDGTALTRIEMTHPAELKPGSAAARRQAKAFQTVVDAAVDKLAERLPRDDEDR